MNTSSFLKSLHRQLLKEYELTPIIPLRLGIAHDRNKTLKLGNKDLQKCKDAKSYFSAAESPTFPQAKMSIDLSNQSSPSTHHANTHLLSL